MQRLPDGVHLAAHPDPLHEAPRRHVGGEAVRRHPAQSDVLEAEPDQLTDRIGGAAVPGVVRVQYPAELGLDAAGLLGDLRLGPRVLDLEHQVDDGLTGELDDDGLAETGRIQKLGAVLVKGWPVPG